VTVMKAPIGFLHLQDAAAMLGRKISGSNWHTIAECEAASLVSFIIVNPAAAELVVHEDPDIDRVITMLAEHCEAGEIATAYRSDTGGVDDLDRSYWRLPHWRNYFITGMVDVDLPRFVPSYTLGIAAIPSINILAGYERCTREIFVRRRDVERFIATLKPADNELGEVPAPIKSEGGRPTDRDRVIAEAGRRIRERQALPGTLTEFADQLKKWLDKQPDARRGTKTGEVMAAATIEDHVRPIWGAYRAKEQ
jgi:hypothetical protein